MTSIATSKGRFAALAFSTCAIFAVAASDTSSDQHSVLTVDGVSLTFADIDARVARIPTEHRATFMDSPKRLEDLLWSMISHKRLALRARDAGLHEDPAFAAEMAQIADEVLARRLLEHLVETAAKPDFTTRAREMYLANPSAYRIPDQREVSHILIRADERSDKEARALARQAAELARTGEVPFTELVARFSEDPSKDTNSGSIGLIGDHLDADFLGAAEQLNEVGQVTDAVKSQFGYHVIKLDSLRPGRDRTFEEVQPAIEMRLEQEFIGRVRREAVEMSRSGEVEADPETIQSLRTRYMPGAPRE